jgi:hypothetical protein
MAGRVILLAGAPLPEELEWDEKVLISTFVPSIQRLLHGRFCNDEDVSDVPVSTTATDPAPSLEPAKWRLLPLHSSSHLATEWTQQTYASATSTALANASFRDPAENRERLSLSSLGRPSFLDATQLDEYDEDTTADFLKHSFKLHQSLKERNLDQSMLDEQEEAPHDGSGTALSSHSFTSAHPGTLSATAATSFDGSFLDSFIPNSAALVQLPKLTRRVNPISLSLLPSAAELHNVSPATPTPTLLVALLSIKARDVEVRSRPRKSKIATGDPRSSRDPVTVKRDILELLVADPSRPCFKITFWIPEVGEPASTSSSTASSAQSALHPLADPLNIPYASLSHLRAGTILLIHRLALTSFRNVVYGQSLNPKMSGLRTRVDVLVDAVGVERVHVMDVGLTAKVKQVREWVERYVVRKPVVKRDRSGGGGSNEEELPQDSQ